MSDVGPVDENLVMNLSDDIPDRAGIPTPGMIAIPRPSRAGQAAFGFSVGNEFNEFTELFFALLAPMSAGGECLMVCVWESFLHEEMNQNDYCGTTRPSRQG